MNFKTLKKGLIDRLTRLRWNIGKLECKLEGRHDPITDVFEFDDDTDRFYPCCRCGCDAISGKSFGEWLSSENKSKAAVRAEV